MNKLNFDGLKSIKAPAEWIEKAAAVPQTQKKRRAAFPFYRVAAAAGIVLVSVIGSMMFLFFSRNNAPIAPAATEARQETDATEPVQGHAILPTGEPVLPEETDGQPDSESAVTPTGMETDPADPQPAEPVLPTDKPAGSEPAPTQPVEPTQSVTPTEPVRPTEPPQTELPKPTQPPVIPTTPPPIEGEMPQNNEGEIGFSALFSSSLLEEGEPVYCAFWRQGYASPAETEFDHQAHYYIRKDGMVYAGYETIVTSEEPPHTVVYEYFFYNSRRQVLARGSQEFYI